MGRKRVKQRAAVGVLGKELTRRSKGRCELCDSRDEVRLYELEPFPEDPTPDRTLMACGRCRRWLDGEPMVAMEAWFLGAAVWHELPAVRLAAGRMLLGAGDLEDPWVVDNLEASGIDPVSRELRG